MARSPRACPPFQASRRYICERFHDHHCFSTGAPRQGFSVDADVGLLGLPGLRIPSLERAGFLEDDAGTQRLDSNDDEHGANHASITSASSPQSQSVDLRSPTDYCDSCQSDDLYASGDLPGLRGCFKSEDVYGHQASALKCGPTGCADAVEGERFAASAVASCQ